MAIVFFFGVLFNSEAQYDVNHDGIDELIIIRVEPSSDNFYWEAVNLNVEHVLGYPAFGRVGDFPLMGRWTDPANDVPAVLRRLSGSQYQLITYPNEASIIITKPHEKRLSLFTGDVDEDHLTDMVFAVGQGRSIIWKGILDPLTAHPRTMRPFKLGRVGDAPFLFQWRVKYKSFGVVEGLNGKNRAIKIKHCMKRCTRIRHFSIPRSLLTGFDISQTLGVGGGNRREFSFLFESSSLSERGGGKSIIVIRKTGQIEFEYAFSEPGTVITGKFSSGSSVLFFGKTNFTAIQYGYENQPEISNVQVISGCPIQIFSRLMGGFIKNLFTAPDECYSAIKPTETPTVITEVPESTTRPSLEPTINLTAPVAGSIPSVTPEITPTSTSSTTSIPMTIIPTATGTLPPPVTPTETATFTSTNIATSTATATSTNTPSSTSTPTLTPTASATSTHSSFTIFVTSLTYNGNRGGISGIDAICNARAGAAGRGAGWMALISTSTVNASARLTIGSPVYNTNAQLLANNGADLWDGTIAASSFYDEFGNGTSDDVWTGSAAGSGVYDGLGCNDWTTGSYGVSGLVSWYGFWFWGEDGTCDQLHHFYCIKGN